MFHIKFTYLKIADVADNFLFSTLVWLIQGNILLKNLGCLTRTVPILWTLCWAKFSSSQQLGSVMACVIPEFHIILATLLWGLSHFQGAPAVPQGAHSTTAFRARQRAEGSWTASTLSLMKGTLWSYLERHRATTSSTTESSSPIPVNSSYKTKTRCVPAADPGRCSWTPGILQSHWGVGQKGFFIIMKNLPW